jgi:hypothetical protein
VSDKLSFLRARCPTRHPAFPLNITPRGVSKHRLLPSLSETARNLAHVLGCTDRPRLFSGPTPSSALSQTPPRARRKAISMHEAAEVVVKSSKTPISMGESGFAGVADTAAEAQSSLTLLTELCPFFLQLKVVARSEWLEMPPQVATIPASPGAGLLASSASLTPGSLSSGLPRLPPMPDSPTRTPRTPRSNKSGEAPRTPVTPGRAAQLAAMHFGGVSPGTSAGGAIAGPASPGRVRRAGGLREVRERIRRELGE